jgi:hypothetical protein
MILVAGFTLGGMVFHSLWALAGVSILALIGDGPEMRVITVSMAIAMLAATVWALLI